MGSKWGARSADHMPRSEEVTPLLVPQRGFGPGSPAVLLPPLLEGQEQVSINCSVMSSTPLRLCPSRTNLMIPGTRSSINHVSCVCRRSWKCISSLSGDRPFCSSAASAGSHPATEVQPPMKALNTNRRPVCARDAPPGTAAGAPSEHWPGLWRAKFQPPPYSCSAPNFGSMSMCRPVSGSSGRESPSAACAPARPRPPAGCGPKRARPARRSLTPFGSERCHGRLCSMRPCGGS